MKTIDELEKEIIDSCVSRYVESKEFTNKNLVVIHDKVYSNLSGEDLEIANSQTGFNCLSFEKLREIIRGLGYPVVFKKYDEWGHLTPELENYFKKEKEN